MTCILKDILTPQQINLHVKATNKNEALFKIAAFASKLKIVRDANKLFEKLCEREKETSTGLQDGFAIPHARADFIKKPCLLFCKLERAVNWESLDGKPTQYVFTILVPEKANNEHLNILSQLSLMLLNNVFTNALQKVQNESDAYTLIAKYFGEKKHEEMTDPVQINQKVNKQINILALTACTVGVAHTYMAAEKLQKAAEKMHHHIVIETHGAVGARNMFTPQQIVQADIVIFATDVDVDKSRFINKPIYETSSKAAIQNPEEVIRHALIVMKNFVPRAANSDIRAPSYRENLPKKSSVMQHLLNGVGYMVPVVILGGIAIALNAGLGKLIYGASSSGAPVGDPIYYLGQIGATAFTIMIGVLGAYIASSIGGRSAIAPAFVACLVGNNPGALYAFPGIPANNVGMGFIGAIFFGLAIGYTVKWVTSWKIPIQLVTIVQIFFIPLGLGLFYSLVIIFIIGAPIAWLMSEFQRELNHIFQSQKTGSNIGIGISIGLGALIGAMAGFDMGGPINKVAFLTSVALISANITEPMGMMAAAVSPAPLGMGLCTLIFRRKFNGQERDIGISALLMGLIGISEGAIPFAVADPKRVIPSNIVGSSVAGAVAGAFGMCDVAAHGGPIVGVLFAIHSDRVANVATATGIYFLVILLGSLVTCFMYGFLRKGKLSVAKNADENKSDRKNAHDKVHFKFSKISRRTHQIKFMHLFHPIYKEVIHHVESIKKTRSTNR